MPHADERNRAVTAARSLPKAFVVGCPKSGTTWVQNILSGHPQAAVAGEGAFAWRLAPLLLQAVKVFNEGQRGSGQPDLALIDDAESLDLLRAAMDLRWGRYVQESPAWRAGEGACLRLVCDKTPQHTVGIRTLERLCPGVRYIHVVRDPRDAAVSAWFHFGKRSGKAFEQFILHFIGVIWPTNVQSARREAPALGDRWFEVHYEALIAEERRWVAAVLERLGLDADDRALDACIASGDFRERSGGREAGNADAASFYRRGVAGDWTDHIGPVLEERACAPVASLMTDLGYTPALLTGSSGPPGASCRSQSP